MKIVGHFWKRHALLAIAALVSSTAIFAQSTNELADPTLPETTASSVSLRWLSITDRALEIDGLPWFAENKGSLSRLPIRDKAGFRKAVWSLGECPSGGRVRFRTDSSILALRLEYSSPPNMANMQAFGQTGVDLYVDGAYMVSVIAGKDAAPGKPVESILFDFSKQPPAEREITLYLPLYKPVNVLGIGVGQTAHLWKAKPFVAARPVAFYGTSITQGGCASRPGMSYQAILGRKLNVDFVNLGFSGNGLGEPEVAAAFARIDASCYVLDFGANHKTFESMREVYAPFLDAVRAAHPETPIVVMTLLYTSREKRIPTLGVDWAERRKFIEQLVRERIRAGDEKLFLVDGSKLLGPTPDDCLVDGGHPNDLGFYRMAEGLAPVLKKALNLSELTSSNRIVPPVSEWKARIPSTRESTKPDFIVFTPPIGGEEISDTGNEHFLVFDGPDHSLMAMWTQSIREGEPDQHIAFSRSADKAKTWSPFRVIAGPAHPGQGLMASWGFPMVSKRGRIYVLYSQNVGKIDTFPHTTGQLMGIFSDDSGTTWSQPELVPVRRSSHDNPDTSFPPNCITWQKPVRLTRDGKYFVGLTRWTSKAVKKNSTPSWISHDSDVEFMRFDNVDDNPAPSDLAISWFAFNENALTVPFPGHKDTSVCQEPSIVKLPDGRFFCVMRTAAGSPYYSISADDGKTWTRPQVLLLRDGGPPIKQPLSPCPIFDLAGGVGGSGKYVLFVHNHDGHYMGYGPRDTQMHRRPIFRLIGHYKSGAEQPVWFDEPQFFFDHDGLLLGPPGKMGRLDLALYSSVTLVDGRPVLWYPDRKFFLLGKYILQGGK